MPNPAGVDGNAVGEVRGYASGGRKRGKGWSGRRDGCFVFTSRKPSASSVVLVERGVQRLPFSLRVGKGVAGEPKYTGNIRRIDADVFPPCGLITAAVNFAMMTAAHGNCELIADLSPKCPALCETEMVRI